MMSRRLRGAVARGKRFVATFQSQFELPSRLWEGTEMLRCVDLHCGGEPATVVFGGGGIASVPGRTMFEKRAHVMEHHDRWREVLLHEPRGYPCSNARARRPSAVAFVAFVRSFAGRRRDAAGPRFM